MRKRKYDKQTHNQGYKLFQKYRMKHFRCLPPQANKPTLEFPIDNTSHLRLKSRQWESAQADKTAPAWVGKGREKADVHSSHDCTPKPKA